MLSNRERGGDRAQDAKSPGFCGVSGQAGTGSGCGSAGARTCAGNGVNSGLVTYCNYPALALFQGSFQECDGNDCSSNKGWTRYMFNKDGFQVIVYNTHTQAGSGSDNVQTRIAQLNQIAVDAAVQRGINPGAVTFIVGDFNIDAWSSEFANVRVAFESAGFVDTRGNLPCSPGFGNCTACSSNTIKQIFGNDGTNTILDHILYSPSIDGTVDIIPTNYEVKTFKRTDGGQWCRNVIPTGCADDLSDHEAIFGNFEIRRIVP
ncbi:MAG: endonuclease/exonuclease/phosphatase family protein [Phycisphaerales bacterium]